MSITQAEFPRSKKLRLKNLPTKEKVIKMT